MVGVNLCLRTNVKHYCMFHHEPVYDDATLHSVLQETMNLSRYSPMDPDMDRSASQKRLKAGGNTLPTHHQATVFLLEPGKGPLGLESWDDLFHWSPTIFLGLPDALRELRPEPTLPELLAEGLCSIPFVCRDVLETLAGAPCCAWAPLDRLEPWEDLGALIPVGRCDAMCPRHPVALGEAVDEEALALPPVGNALAPPSQGEKAPATAPYSQRIIPWSSAIPSIRAGLAASGPSACHRCSQRCVALFDAHGSPRGTAHHRQPVIKMYNNVCNTLRKGACGIP